MSADRIQFGDVGLEVDSANGHCTFHVHRIGPIAPVPHQFRLHGLDEVEGAMAAWVQKSGAYAANMRAALRHAGRALGGRS